MKFSVVTISFNQAEFLERTILSVLNQKEVEIEYIVVDPGSTDGSRDIIERYRSQIAHVVYEPDEGAADGLNKGFAKASGDVFCYLNSDDTFLPDALIRAQNMLEKFPDADVICGHANVIDGNDRILRRVWSDRFNINSIAYGTSVQIQPSTFIRRQAFSQTNGFNKLNRSNWDGELLVDLFKTGARIRTVEGFYSNYRLHSVSITNSGSLSKRINEWSDRRFELIMGRKPESYDKYIRCIYLFVKYLQRPIALSERIFRGRIYQRNVK